MPLGETNPLKANPNKVRYYLGSIAMSNEARRRLLEQGAPFRTIAGVTNELNLDADVVEENRSKGSILAVPDHGRWLYPDFQFSKGKVSSMIKQAYEARRGRMSERTVDPWDILTFFCVRRHPLGRAALKDCLWNPQYTKQVAEIVDHALF